MSNLRMSLSLAAAALFAMACGRDKTELALEGSAAPAYDTLTAALSGLQVGEAVPLYRARVLAGDSLSIGGAADSVTLLNVWATWCTSCREEMQDLESLHRAYSPRGIRVVAVSLDAGSETLVRRFVTREKLTFPVIHDQQGRLQSLYHVGGVPSTYVIARDGRLLWQRTGGLHGSVDLATAALDRALAASNF